MDNLTASQRKKNMRAIKSTNTSIEIILRQALWHLGVRYRKNYKILGYCPDIVLTKYKIAIFCDGDYWHGKPGMPKSKTNSKYWEQKIKRNREHDLDVTMSLRDNHWSVIRFWESDIKSDLNGCIQLILKEIKQRTKNNDYI